MSKKRGTIQFFCMSLVILIIFTSIIIYKRNLDDYLDKLDELDQSCKCKSVIIQRIINGNLEDKLFFPWHVSIATENRHICMGTIINQYHIITAQHCINNDYSKNNYDVRVSLYELFDPKIEEKTYRVDEIYKYPSFIFENSLDGGDIAILKLKKPIKFNDYVQPSCIDFKEFNFENLNQIETAKKQQFITSGFGTNLPVIYHNNKLIGKITPSLVLKTAYFTEVIDLFLNDTKIKPLLEKFICINPLDKENACRGDSGSSLNYLKSNGLTIVNGIASSSIPIQINETTIQFCKSYSMYSRLSYYKEFIDKIVGDLRCKIENLNGTNIE